VAAEPTAPSAMAALMSLRDGAPNPDLEDFS